MSDLDISSQASSEETYMSLQSRFAKGLRVAFEKLGCEVNEIPTEEPQLRSHGDITSPVALGIFKTLSTEQKQEWGNPRAFAEKIIEALPKESQSFPFHSVSVAGPGFINAFVSDSYMFLFAQRLAGSFAQLPKSTKNGTSYIVEYMQPNTNKPLHIGHLRNAALGFSMISLLRQLGAPVAAATINNDRGLHITKSMWAYCMFAGPEQFSESEEDIGSQSWISAVTAWSKNPSSWQQPGQASDKKMQKPDHFVGHWYSLADKYVGNKSVETTWSEMLQAWEDSGNPQHEVVRALWKTLNAWFYEGYEQSAEMFGFEFDPDQVSYESDLYLAGKETIVKGAEQGIFERIEGGAIRARLSKYNLPDKVLLRSDGTGIYMTFDIELTRQRSLQHADKYVWVVGNDQKLYFQQLFAVCEQLGYGTRDQFTHFSYGMVRLPEGKMSSRKGLVVYADDLIEQAIDRARAILNETEADKRLSPEEKDQVAQAVGVGAIKWSLVSQDPLSSLTFDITESVSFKGYSGPYIQYTYARAKSVLRSAQESGYEIDRYINQHIDIEINQEEKEVLRNLLKYIDIFMAAADDWAPHRIAQYLHDLAQAYNALYNSHKIVMASTDEERSVRLLCTTAVAAVLKKGLESLGISVLEQM